MFDPSAVAEKNGNYFGFPCSTEEAEILLLGVPWDVTTSYRDGAVNGPEAILEASTQLDFVSPFRKEAWKTRIGTLSTPKKWKQTSKRLRKIAKEHISRLESGKKPKSIDSLNKESAKFHREVYEEVKRALSQAPVITIGGDHSISHGPILAYQDKYPDLCVLHIDAHADLRVNYEGFPHSHASIMNLVEAFPQVKKIVQVGIRDYAPMEWEKIQSSKKIHTFFDWEIQKQKLEGSSWKTITKQIVSQLGQNVYLSFDVDGLDPQFCPNTGTPVAGGLNIQEVYFLLDELVKSGKKLVGADLVEVAPDPKGLSDWDANVGARLIFQIAQFIQNSQTK